MLFIKVGEMGIVGMSQTSVYELMNEWIDSDELRSIQILFYLEGTSLTTFV